MGIFDPYRLNLVEVEDALGRALRGDPAQGEIGVVCSLAGGRLTEARERLGTPNLGPDFRDYVNSRLASAGSPKIEVTLPPLAAEALRQRAAQEGRSVDQIVGILILRAAGRAL